MCTLNTGYGINKSYSKIKNTRTTKHIDNKMISNSCFSFFMTESMLCVMKINTIKIKNSDCHNFFNIICPVLCIEFYFEVPVHKI